MGVPRYLGLHRLQLRSRSPGTYLSGLGYSPNVGGIRNSLIFASQGREIRHLPLPPPARRRQPHLASSSDPCSTPLPTLPLPCLSAQRKYERQPRQGGRCLLECPLLRARPAL